MKIQLTTFSNRSFGKQSTTIISLSIVTYLYRRESGMSVWYPDPMSICLSSLPVTHSTK